MVQILWLKSPWSFALAHYGLKFYKCSTNPCFTLSSINGHSLIWCPIWWQYVQRGGLGLGIMFTLWIPLFQSLGIPLTMLPFYWLNLSSPYLILTTISTPSTAVGFALGKTTISCLPTSIYSSPSHIWMPWVATSCLTR
jgi:hypothetical protein